LRNVKFGVRASGFVELEMHRRRVVRRIGGSVPAERCAECASSASRGIRMIPELFQVSQQLLALLGCEVWGQSAGVFQTLLQLRGVG
jgi:hypothetical protein